MKRDRVVPCLCRLQDRNKPPAVDSRHLPWVQDSRLTNCAWQQLLKEIPENKGKSRLQAPQSRG